MAEAYPNLLAGQRITSALLNSMLPMTARKTADTSRASTATATPDPHITFSVAANAVYVWWGWLKYDGDSTVGSGDIRVDFDVPSGSLGEWTALGVGVDRVISATDATTPAFTTDTQRANGYLIRTESNDVDAARTYGTLTSSTNAITLQLKGTLRVGSTAGTFNLSWAQANSSAVATTIYTDSWICMQRIA